ncbi:MAG: hypothetical protein SGJ20_07010, partial [Planctomycetota bacterium]|nr:hypothetical protein [Planctomycetota bacterium]
QTRSTNQAEASFGVSDPQRMNDCNILDLTPLLPFRLDFATSIEAPLFKLFEWPIEFCALHNMPTITNQHHDKSE